MRDEILTYWEMCSREGIALQRGMYYRPYPAVSIALMSQRPGAPYVDTLSPDGTGLTYEGHDVPRGQGDDPKTIDQPWTIPSGKPTENARFAAATERPDGERQLVRVYEKLRPGIWSDKGLFELVRYEYLRFGVRKAFRFRMRLSDAPDEIAATSVTEEFKRAIPTHVKQEVWKRDGGACVICGAQDQLHFDHELPFSKGGTGLTAQNVRILCARHNLQKGAKIQ